MFLLSGKRIYEQKLSFNNENRTLLFFSENYKNDIIIKDTSKKSTRVTTHIPRKGYFEIEDIGNFVNTAIAITPTKISSPDLQNYFSDWPKNGLEEWISQNFDSFEIKFRLLYKVVKTVDLESVMFTKCYGFNKDGNKRSLTDAYNELLTIEKLLSS